MKQSPAREARLRAPVSEIEKRAMAALCSAPMDTREIGLLLGVSEAEVANELHRQREAKAERIWT